MKKTLKAALFAAVLTALTALSAFAAGTYGKVTADTLNLRSAPSTSGSVIGTAAKDEVLKILEDTGTGWLKVEKLGLASYASAQYVRILPEDEAPKIVKGVVTAGTLNVRAGPSSRDKLLTTVAKDTEVAVLEEIDGWYKIQFGIQTGYVSKEYVRLTSEPGAPDTAGGTPARVTAPLVNIRSGAGMDFPVLTTAAEGETVYIMGVQGLWCKVVYKTTSGYMLREYLGSEEPQPPAPPPSAAREGTVTGAVVNIRSGAGTAYPVVGTAYRDEKVAITAEENGWYKITKGATTGYILAEYVDAAPAEPDPSTHRKAVMLETAGIYKGPGMDYDKVSTVSKDTIVSVMQEESGWAWIKHGSVSGYVKLSQIKYDGEAPAAPGEAVNRPGVVTADSVNVRAGAGTAFTVIGQAYKNDKVTVKSAVGDWYAVTYGTMEGFIHSQYVSFDAAAVEKGLVTGSNVNLRKSPSTDSEILTMLPRGSYVDILEKGALWHMVRFGEISGFMSAEYINIGAIPYSRPVSSAHMPGNNATGKISTLGKDALADAREALCAYALSFVGVPYVYGGSTPQSGFDCSGFTKYVYNGMGYDLPRTEQYNAGIKADKSALLPGDLLFFGSNGNINHVGLYLGYGKYIHAPEPGRSVCVATLDVASARFISATRIIY